MIVLFLLPLCGPPVNIRCIHGTTLAFSVVLENSFTLGVSVTMYSSNSPSPIKASYGNSSLGVLASSIISSGVLCISSLIVKGTLYKPVFLFTVWATLYIAVLIYTISSIPGNILDIVCLTMYGRFSEGAKLKLSLDSIK